LISRTNENFWKSYDLLPVDVKKKAKRVFKLFQIESSHPSLHFKQIHSKQQIFSIRISRSYRALGVVQKDEIIWFWIGSHSDYDNMINFNPQEIIMLSISY
jgi:hypothetical protein